MNNASSQINKKQTKKKVINIYGFGWCLNINMRTIKYFCYK